MATLGAFITENNYHEYQRSSCYQTFERTLKPDLIHLSGYQVPSGQTPFAFAFLHLLASSPG